MKQEKVSFRQLMALLWAGLLGPAAEWLPSMVTERAGPAGWLVPLLALPVLLAAGWLAGSLSRGAGGLSQGLMDSLGPGAGRAVLTIYIIWMELLLALRLRLSAQRMMAAGERDGALWFFLPVLVLMALWISWGKAGRLARTGELFFLLLAAAAAVWGEVPVEAIQLVGSNFTGVEHRIEPVRVLDGVTYYNDSIGTSPTRTIAGLRSFDQKVILIAGGYDKHIPYEPLAPEITAHVKNLVLMGATGPRIEKAVREDPNFNEAELPIQHADNMQHAVELARACAKPGDIIILSPASASFDLYPNFEVRGREFKSIVNALK